MIRLCAVPKVEWSGTYDRWDLTLYTPEQFEYDGRFRAYLDRICQVADAEVTLPEDPEDDDFVDGELVFEGRQIAVYYEYALGYLSFSAEDREGLDRLLKHIAPLIAVAG